MKTKLATFSLLLLASVAGAAQPLAYVALEQPCRALDTRTAPHFPLVPGAVFVVDVMTPCEIPFEAKAVAANITATNTQGAGFISVLRPIGRPETAPTPRTSVLNYVSAGQTVANAALVTLGEPINHWGGVFWLVAAVSGTDVIVDISGYYVPIAP